MLLDIRKIEERLKGVTPGPWCEAPGNFIVTDARGDDPTTGQIVAEVPCQKGNERDVQFIAHARSDIPRLCAEVKRLRKALVPMSRRRCEAIVVWDGDRCRWIRPRRCKRMARTDSRFCGVHERKFARHGSIRTI